ncbi:PREDICTED: FYVE, RhoGEF and PH domain-containing protein 6 [Crocodylus porosus]|uniref:FYVE, RhoGEF and PH domain-containing protein 6 n=1 Tax=Crocodylus porosus TaxID=8502 RepID=A0A7M4FQF2_CROPO|nr:PREDICTED: FYVE, RhoGEF and PH domain-containing protein 6 [Crocodylus porosus]
MSSAEIKKPPVAPKPKSVLGHKATPPPPVAPKPDIGLSGVMQTTRKTKPAIAPKPKVLKSSSIPEVRPPSSLRKSTKSLEEHKGDSSETLDHLNYKNGAPGEDTRNTTYIIPVSSCNFECLHKLGNGESTCKTQITLEQLEHLENIKLGEQNASPMRNRAQSEKLANRNHVVLKASFLEEKLKDVLTQSVFPNTSPLRHRYTDKLERGNNSEVRIEITDLVQSSECEEATGKQQNNHNKRAADEFQMTETCPHLTQNNYNFSCPMDQENLENVKVNSNIALSGGVGMKTDGDKHASSPEICLTPSLKVLPVPKPRKTRAACLVRQDGIDAIGEGTREPVCSEGNSFGPPEHNFKKTAKINVISQSVSYNDHLDNVHQADKSERVHPGKEPTDTEELASQNLVPQVLHETSNLVENVGHSLDKDLNLINPADKITDDSSMLAAIDKRTNFIRTNTLSMSLPKQLKLACNQHFSASNSLDISAQKTEDREINVKDESSPRIAPKKPQRHSLPAAGLLKKAASEELIEKSSYVSSEDKKFESVLEGTCIRHTSAKEQDLSSSCDVPKRASEKPVWKLPRPILPFSGNPESLKMANIATGYELPTAVTKPRAKSLSSVDMDRIHKPSKDPQKKNSLKKFLNMKLSVCIMKSDFHKFLSKGSQSLDGAISSLSMGEGNRVGNSQNVTFTANERKTKSAKAHSVETGSPASQKKRHRHRSQHETASSQRTASLDEQIFSVEQLSQTCSNCPASNCAPEYGNVPHYEDIPEYENLPFAAGYVKSPCFEWQNSSSVEYHRTHVYEVEEPYETTNNHSRCHRPSEEHHDDPSVTMGDLQSDDEIMNSSDEDDDTNSDSSKGELDPQDKQSKAAEKKTKVYHIAKEIMSSEKVFVDVLKLLHIDFRDAVAHASRQSGKPVIEDRILNQILYYLPQLYELNRDLLRELEERLSHWIAHQRIADIFVKKGPYLKMYSTYIKEFDKNIALLDEQCKRNPSFAAAVKDFEMSPRCASLALKHYLLKPVQRIPQYRLLLTDYLKNLLEESADYRDTQDALAVVIEVANHANDIMKQGDNFQKLMQIQYSLNGHHEIVQPGRVFLKEGTLMKLSRKVMQPRMFFLFNDALLYTTPVQSGMYKLNNMLSLTGMKVRKPTHEAYQNELNIESVERSFILSASSATERDEWLEAISRSIEEYTKKRITFNPSRSLEETDPEKEEEDSPLGSKAPIWIPDTRATMCMICTSEFTLTWRRHHCRACGKIVCQACSLNKHGLDYMKNQPARVCDHCFRELQKQDNQCTPKSGSPVTHKSPSSALSTVLHSIPSGRKQKKIPAALKEVSANTEDSTMSGYLYRSKGSKKPWKHLWFVIKNKVLYTYAASEDVAALESQPLLGFTVTEVKDENSDSKVFHLLHKNTLFYIFKADDPHSAQKWIEAFQEGTVL